MRCLTSAKFTMNAELLRWTAVSSTSLDPIGTGGTWTTYQDPITLEVMNKWVPETLVPDNTGTVENEYEPVTISCLARGLSSREIFGSSYDNVEIVKLWVPAGIDLSKSDRITNIRDKKNGTVLWKDGDKPTVFNVSGITPSLDPWNRHVQDFVLLERADF